jgi:hypothetical protein
MTELQEEIALSEHLLHALLADLMQTKLLADGFSAEEVAATIGPDNAEEVLTGLVEGGDVVLDDGSVHKAFRDMLDDHRDRLRRMYEVAQELGSK